ncbi:beta-ketoacyl synthase N-terminal-like domain-containing protein, partial [Streptomyces sp. NPDC005752]|uniref:type I polyketide synthase n=1 Tax=Streptomyces sp. NPDC005752 TaxID=3157065 RepID=UPI0033BFBD16
MPALLRGLVRKPPRRTAGGQAGAQGWREQFRAAAAADRDAMAVDVVRAQAALVLGHTGDGAVAADRAFKDLGFDSLTAVELRNRLDEITGVRLPVTLVFDYPTPVLLGAHLSTVLEGSAAAPDRTVRPVTTSDEPIAIVGMSCRFPGGVSSPEELWTMLDSGGEGLGEFPTDRGWALDGLFDPTGERPGSSLVDKGGFLDGIADFDAGFFGVAPREAVAMDPQHRLLLELSWEAIERAGIDATGLRGSRTGVFSGLMYHDYAARLTSVPEGIAGFLSSGNAGSVATGRVAYSLGFEGPAVTVDTACSSSLVALDMAVSALQRGECDLALAGGVTVMATPTIFAEFTRQRGLAADGRCKAFSTAADGMGVSEGAGVVMVERLSDARRNGHRVLAVVRGSAVNQDGASNGLTAPNGPSQQRVIRQALANAGVASSDVDVVEAHGTGTSLGDPIEAQALLATYGQERTDGRPVLLGSVKSNIGHTQAAAGVAGVIKMVMAMRHGTVPATLHVDEPSPHIDWSSGAVELATEALPWPETDRPRRAAVSSFGISGTNAHVILEQAPEEAAPTEEAVTGGVLPWVLSAKTADALCGQAARLRDFAAGHDDVVATAAALTRTRAVFDHRAVVLAADPAGFADKLDHLARQEAYPPDVVSGTARPGAKVAFVFPGQGAQWTGMALGLLDSSAVFAQSMARCGTELSAFVEWDLFEVLRDEEALRRVDVVQPVLWAVMVSLAEVWRAAGITPAVVVGHSQGEIAAAHVAGVLSLAESARIVVTRSGVIADGLPGRGGMASLAVSAERAEELIERYAGKPGTVSVAAVNGPSAVILAGDEEPLRKVLEGCATEGARARLIPVNYPSHSPQVALLRDRLVEELGEVTADRARTVWHSTVTGEPVSGPEADAAYWYRNLREPVRFADVVARLVEQGVDTFIEVSPHPVVTSAVEDIALAAGAEEVVAVGSLRREHDEPAALLRSAATLWTRGLRVDWSALAPGSTDPVDLPTYAFQRERYWLQAPPLSGDVRDVGLEPTGHHLLTAAVTPAGTDTVLFTGRLATAEGLRPAENTVQGTALLPGGVPLGWALHAAQHLGCGAVAHLELETPLALDAAGAVRVQVMAGAPDEESRRELTVHSQPEDLPEAGWTRMARGLLDPAEGRPDEEAFTELAGVWPPAGAEAVDVEGFYDELFERGHTYGPAYQGLRAAWHRDDEMFAEVLLPDEAVDGTDPESALLEAVWHAWLQRVAPAGPLVPASWSGVRQWAAGARSVRVRLSAVGDDAVRVQVADELGVPVMAVDELVLRPVSVGSAGGRPLYGVRWDVWEPVVGLVGGVGSVVWEESLSVEEVVAVVGGVGSV